MGNKLTTEQLASLSGDRNIMVLAGAGTGKTRALTERVLYLITQKKIKPSELLVLTFTRKAASEMKERIYNRLLDAHFRNPGDLHLESAVHHFREMTINTFHGFFASLLREYGYHLGVHHQFKVMEEDLDLQLLVEKAFLKILQTWGEKRPDDLTAFFTFYNFEEMKMVTKEILKNWILFRETLTFYRSLGILNEHGISPEKFKEIFFIKPDLDWEEFERIIQNFLNDTFDEIERDQKSKSKIIAALRTIIPELQKEMEAAANPFEKTGLFYKKLSGFEIEGKAKSIFTKNEKLFSKSGISNRLREIFDLYNTQISEFLERFYLTPSRIHDYFCTSIDEAEFRQYIHVLLLWLNWGEDVINEYTRLKKAMRMMDFHDLEFYCNELFNQRPDVVQKLKQKFSYVMVDEFQDTNSLQWELLWQIVSEGSHLQKNKLFIVGDKKQAIYGFRGGEVEMCDIAEEVVRKSNENHQIHNLPLETVSESHVSEDMRKGIIPFVANFRSAESLLKFFNAFGKVIFPDSNPEPFDTVYQPLKSLRHSDEQDLLRIFYGFYQNKREENGKSVKISSAELKELEAQTIASFLRKVLDEDWEGVGELMQLDATEAEKNWKWLSHQMQDGKKSVGILFRRKTHLPVFERALIAWNLPFKMESGQSLFEQQEIRDILHLIKWLNDPADDSALIGFARSSFWGLSDLMISLFSLMRSGTGNTFFDKMESLKNVCNSDYSKLDSSLITLQELFDKNWDEFRELFPDEFSDIDLGKLVFPADDWKRWMSGYEHLRHLRKQIFEKPLFSLFLEAIQRFQIMESVKHFPDGEQKLANLREFMTILNTFVVENSSPDILSFLNYVDSLKKGNQIGLGETDDEAVIQVMTVHKSKGLEFPLVILADLEAESSGSTFKKRDILLMDRLVFQSPWKDHHGWEFPNLDPYIPSEFKEKMRFPLILPRSGKITSENFYYPLEHYVFYKDQFREYAEERRLLYVAMTRAEKALFILSGTESPVFIERKNVVTNVFNWNEILQQCFTTISFEENLFLLREEFGDLPVHGFRVQYIETEQLQNENPKKLPSEELIPIPGGKPSRIVLPSQLGEDIKYESTIYNLNIPETEFGTLIHEMMEKGFHKKEDEELKAILKRKQPVLTERELNECIRHIRNASEILDELKKDFPEIRTEIPFYSLNFPEEGISMKGVIDVLLINPSENRGLILDYKTNFVDAPDKEYAAAHGYDLQLTAYCYVAEEIMKVRIEKAILLFTYSSRTVEYSREEWRSNLEKLQNEIRKTC